MGATHSSKKKSSSKSIRRKEDYELREEEQSEGRSRRFSLFRKSRFDKRCVEVENKAANAANDSDYKYNIVNYEVNNHNFLEYKLLSIKKKYQSNNDDSTEKITEKNYPEQFNPFAIETEYSNILNPFDDDDDDEVENPLENTENSTNNSEIHSIESFNHEDIVEDKETCESIKVNSTSENTLMATYDEINDSDAVHNMEEKEKCESIKVNSTPRSLLMATYEDNTESEVKGFDKNEDDFVDFYNSESKTAKLNISEKETHSVLENEKETEMMTKEDNLTEIISNKEELTSKTPVSDTASYSEIVKFNQNETTEKYLKTTSSDTNKDNLQNSTTIVPSLEKVSCIQALETVDNFISPYLASEIEDKETPENIRNNFNPENPLSTIDVKKRDPKINAIEIDYNEKRNPFCEFQNPVNETANINNNPTPKNDSSSKNINSDNVPSVIKKKSFKKYKAPAPPVFPTLPLKLESHKENENASKIQNLKQSITPTSLLQEEPKNTYRISRPAPAPPVPESLKPVRAIGDTAPKSKKIIPINERGRKFRRKSILDLFKITKKKKKMIDMF